ncbi:MAG TPA: phosphoribosylglycinamide formyltransferase [bacterium]|nr:phosphoribosylglycinamide formyltransferase [bacterium]HPO99999.1 phosphoribosylglycinamide formyltransferase [bacterium]HXK93186.1 phosphoribosylglycinamide formyltransferase [bacterium]
MTSTKPLRCVVLLSGSGTTLQNLIDQQELGQCPIEIVRVISSHKEAFGLERARKHNIPAVAFHRKDYDTWEAFNEDLVRAVDEVKPDLILLAGFMFLFRPGPEYHGRIMNVHPALIPAFCGKGMYGHHVHEAVLAYGVKITGATVHFVDEGYDTGPIILQKAVEVYDDDTPETLAARVQAAEREIYPEAIRLFAANRLRIEGRRVKIVDPPLLDPSM